MHIHTQDEPYASKPIKDYGLLETICGMIKLVVTMPSCLQIVLEHKWITLLSLKHSLKPNILIICLLGGKCVW